MTEAQQRLAAFLESRRDARWAWGTHDCLQFTSGAVKAWYGIDHAERFGTYSKRSGAYRRLCEFADIAEFISAILGPPQPRNAVRHGYVVTAYSPYGETSGFALENTCVFAASPRGICTMPLKEILHCWPVPAPADGR